MNTEELVTVYTVTNPTEAEIIKNYLQSEGVACFLEGINQGGFEGWIGQEIKLQVAPNDADKARQLIETHEALEEIVEE